MAGVIRIRDVVIAYVDDRLRQPGAWRVMDGDWTRALDVRGW